MMEVRDPCRYSNTMQGGCLAWDGGRPGTGLSPGSLLAQGCPPTQVGHSVSSKTLTARPVPQHGAPDPPPVPCPGPGAAFLTSLHEAPYWHSFYSLESPLPGSHKQCPQTSAPVQSGDRLRLTG
ncbi:hypothetical protein KIL84_020697 [Mauremys mutica]|uniref:Uncharacterized protein n=1 Tax=Mauremys mutica TaxID=74926 RepID=A0A9D4AZ92_9SAUR|nr:hypothetical protein KIL84_020697 [Mauremys mutica]